MEDFDYAILACHADQSMRIVSDLNHQEKKHSPPFLTKPTKSLSTPDTDIMPKTHLAWASWNYRIAARGERLATLTYNMTMLQG